MLFQVCAGNFKNKLHLTCLTNGLPMEGSGRLAICTWHSSCYEMDRLCTQSNYKDPGTFDLVDQLNSAHLIKFSSLRKMNNIPDTYMQV